MSNNKSVGVVVHISEELQQEQINTLESSLVNDRGVRTARVNRDRKHLMLVDFIPGVVTARQVLNHVRNKGYNAALVGWI